MAKRKAKGKAAAKSTSKSQSKASPQAKANSTSRYMAIGVIAVSLLVLVIYAATASGPSGTQTNATGTNTNTNTSVAPPMTGTESKTVGAVDAAKAKVTTFKLQELSGTDCLDHINGELAAIGGVGKVTADYDNKLFEVEHDPSKITEAKIIEVLTKTDHPGQVTSERIKK